MCTRQERARSEATRIRPGDTRAAAPGPRPDL